jgi:Cft2 family RNA processing exonuclease
MIPKTITITHLGAKTCVTGYCHLVQARHDHSAPASLSWWTAAFALGRTQELIYELDRINPRVPVFIDSLLGIRICQ